MGFDIGGYVKKAQEAKIFGGAGNYLRDGKYTLAVCDILIKENRKQTATNFIVSAEVVTSAPVSVQGEPSKPNLPGERVTVMANLKEDYGPPNMFKFVLALHNLRQGQLDEATMAALINEMRYGDTDGDKHGTLGKDGKPMIVQPCRGMLISNTTSNKRDKKPTEESFVYSNWRHLAEEYADKAAIAARRAKLGGDSNPT